MELTYRKDDPCFGVVCGTNEQCVLGTCQCLPGNVPNSEGLCLGKFYRASRFPLYEASRYFYRDLLVALTRCTRYFTETNSLPYRDLPLLLPPTRYFYQDLPVTLPRPSRYFYRDLKMIVMRYSS